MMEKLLGKKWFSRDNLLLLVLLQLVLLLKKKHLSMLF